jgi:hypothetical protein
MMKRNELAMFDEGYESWTKDTTLAGVVL